MIPNPDDLHAWIFVSHASADLDHVRRVRNYLEEKGASPLLFHLRALTDERKFWPIIEQEIAARNFFLYCDSAAAQASPWVKRERETVAEIARLRPVRVGRISVEEKVIDATGLDRFIAKTRVFPSYASKDRNIVEPYLPAPVSRFSFRVRMWCPGRTGDAVSISKSRRPPRRDGFSCSSQPILWQTGW